MEEEIGGLIFKMENGIKILWYVKRFTKMRPDMVKIICRPQYLWTRLFGIF